MNNLLQGWTYRLDGALLKATRITGIQNFNVNVCNKCCYCQQSNDLILDLAPHFPIEKIILVIFLAIWRIGIWTGSSQSSYLGAICSSQYGHGEISSRRV